MGSGLRPAKRLLTCLSPCCCCPKPNHSRSRHRRSWRSRRRSGARPRTDRVGVWQPRGAPRGPHRPSRPACASAVVEPRPVPPRAAKERDREQSAAPGRAGPGRGEGGKGKSSPRTAARSIRFKPRAPLRSASGAPGQAACARLRACAHSGEKQRLEAGASRPGQQEGGAAARRAGAAGSGSPGSPSRAQPGDKTQCHNERGCHSFILTHH